MKRRLWFAAAVGIAAGVVNFFYARSALADGALRPDFDQLWFASRALLTGHDPYPLIGPGRAFEWPFRLNYPLPALLVLAPIAWLPLAVARFVFVTGGVGCFALAITVDGFDLAPLLLSGPILGATLRAQWSPWLAAAYFLPPLRVLYCAKPTIAAALWVARPEIRWPLWVAAAITVVSFAFVPRWPIEWWRDSHYTAFVILVAIPWGWLLLLALARWRCPEGRMLGLLALVPFTPTYLYDALYPLLVARTRRVALVLAGLSLAAYFAFEQIPFAAERRPSYLATVAHVALWAIYLPAMIALFATARGGSVSSSVHGEA